MALLLVAVSPAYASRSITEPLPAADSTVWAIHGFEIGPTLSLPLMRMGMNRLEPGADAGVRATLRATRELGFGVDLAYHYWPMSRSFKAQFNETFRQDTWNTLELGEGTWGWQVIEYGGHVRVDFPKAHGVRAWTAVGLHSFHVNPNTSGYSGDAGFFYVVSAPPLKATDNLGHSVALGADFFGNHHARMGLDATFYYVSCRDHYYSDLRVFTLGAHMLFGW